jgi:acyl-CoA synthetase (AMP-forming)/AMP-acid ligase II
LLFVDGEVAAGLAGSIDPQIKIVGLDAAAPHRPFEDWIAPPGARPDPVDIDPETTFNIIYSSGTTGTPKGIVHTHQMRWSAIGGMGAFDGSPSIVSLVSTPLYSNTTLAAFLPTLGLGGCAVLMRKFEATAFLELAQRHRVSHAMLVPVQYRRLLQHPGFDTFDLSSFRTKFSTSAPFPAELKAEVLRRWPGGLVDYYGMTEGGGVLVLAAHLHPDKLHTVGRPAPGHDVRLIDESGLEVGPGVVGEVVGRSGAMMAGYNNRPGATAEAEWFDADGARFIRTGDLGRFDEDGFLELIGRKKDMIISGGFNIYPSDLEAVIVQYPDVLEVAVVGVRSDRWGETPVAFVTERPGRRIGVEDLSQFVAQRLNKTQRPSSYLIVDELPRSPIGKVLKRELRASWSPTASRETPPLAEPINQH